MNTRLYKLKIFVITVFCFAFSAEVIAQWEVRGKVTNEEDLPLVGVSVKLKDKTTGTVTNTNGEYVLQASDGNGVLVFSYVGYTDKEESINGRKVIDVNLGSDVSSLEEVVVVAYGTQKKISVTGALTTVQGEELAKSPVPNLAQAMVGRTSGILTQQVSGQPGNDDVTIRIRGTSTIGDNSPLVLVDGVERPFTSISPDEVDNITVLKDASTTAVYGIRGANGVILVTTKRGKSGRPKISFSSNSALQAPTRLPDFANSYDYATLYNEAMRNDRPGITDAELLFKPEDLEKFKDGSSPVLHPDVDWFEYMMKPHALQTKQTLSVSGGKAVRYFVSLGYFDQGGLWKEFNEQFDYSNNTTYNRYNFRSNLDFDITPSTKFGLSIGGIAGRTHTAGNPFTLMQQTPPMVTPGLVGDKLILNDLVTARNPISSISGGFDENHVNQLTINGDINQKLDFITKGLSVRARLAYDSNYGTQLGKNVTRVEYKPVLTLIDGQETIVYQPLNDESIGGVSSISFYDRSKRVYFEGALQYDRSFGNHNVGGLFLYNQHKQWWHGLERYTPQYPEVPIGYLGTVARLTYDYDYRYLLEFSIGRNGSENFPEGKRFGIFPAISAGWNVTREPFMQQLLGDSKVLSLLKFRASYGETGNDKSRGYRFLYFPSEYFYGASRAVFGEDLQQYESVYEGKLGNPDITWEKAVKQNYAVESGFFNDRLNFTYDYFIDYRNNILNSRPVVAHVAAAIQDVYNVAKVRNKGHEFTLGWKDKVGNLGYWVNGNYTFARNTVIYNAQPQDPNNPNTWTTGISLNQTLGLISYGFFNTQEEADAWPTQFASRSTPGDVRYIDVNGDGVINELDITPIGAPTYPEVNFGSTMGLSYKGFDFSILFQGATNVSTRLWGYMREPGRLFAGMLNEVKEQRWTPENMENATRPKLTVTYANASNYQVSSLWQRDASYFRIKNAELGYAFSGNFLSRFNISSARLFVSGQNLHMWDKLKIVDPEQEPGNGFRYPQLKVFNAGINIQF